MIVRVEPRLLTCRYASSAARAQVSFDDLPQAWRRWQRAQVERVQTAVEWSNTPAQRPEDVHDVGAGAFWVRAPRELVASDGQRLLTVRVLVPRDPSAARRVAVRVARAGLGPSRVPVGTGP